MAVFTMVELMQLTAGMTDQQRGDFQSQYYAQRKNRMLVLVVSIVLGGLGIDRFMVGDTGLALLKLLTGGVFGILWLLDIFLIPGRVDEYNRHKAHQIAQDVTVSGPSAAPQPLFGQQGR